MPENSGMSQKIRECVSSACHIVTNWSANIDECRASANVRSSANLHNSLSFRRIMRRKLCRVPSQCHATTNHRQPPTAHAHYEPEYQNAISEIRLADRKFARTKWRRTLAGADSAEFQIYSNQLVRGRGIPEWMIQLGIKYLQQTFKYCDSHSGSPPVSQNGLEFHLWLEISSPETFLIGRQVRLEALERSDVFQGLPLRDHGSRIKSGATGKDSCIFRQFNVYPA